ncbi:MAG: ABC transporter ATP-binding protein [Candidatus Eisenbacteria bacterium]|nr:ABC transporter ATP-binding protein [Candidatus Eisenbacteria bacterium]
MSEPEHEEDLGRAYDHQLVRRLTAYLRPYRWQVAFAVLVTLAQAAVQLTFPWLTKEAIDLGIRHRDLYALDRIALLYLVALLAAFALGYLQSQIMQGVAQRVMRDLRTSLFRKLQELPASYYDRNPIGRLMTRVTNDVDVLNEMFTSGVDALFGDIFMLIGIVFAMAQLNVELLAVTFSVLPLIFAVTMTFRAKVRRVFRDVRSKLARLNSFLNENLSGMTTVQLLGREERNAAQFRQINAEHRDANLLANTYHAVFFPLLEIVSAIALSLIVWYGGRQVMWTGITLGTLVAFIQYTQRFFRPISDLSEKYGILQQAMASSERIFALLDTPSDPASADFSRPAPVRPARGEGAAGAGLSVEFENVWFAYGGEHWVLKNVSFRVEAGEKVALVGATGSGKSTIASLLLRFYSPQRGTIRVDGRPLQEWDAEALRQRVGLVLQDVFLFSGPIESNLRMDDPALSRETVVRSAHEVHAHEFIERLPGQYDGELRERGASLSAGEKQLLSFARTLARDPDLLILDEATSSVDTHTEQLIQDGLHRLMRDRTSLVIAHRLSTIQDVDRIVVLHHGEVRETGTHAELMALEGLYSRLYQLQYLGGRRGSARAEAEVSSTDI